jgi:hypothetical protein
VPGGYQWLTLQEHTRRTLQLHQSHIISHERVDEASLSAGEPLLGVEQVVEHNARRWLVAGEQPPAAL